jgi:hypothetical protein
MATTYQRGNQNLYIEEEQTTQDSDLSLWYLLAIVLSVLLRYTDSDYPIGIFWALCRLLFFDIQILQNPYIEELTTQWPKDTKGVNPNPYIEEELTTQWQTDTKGLIRICISKKS